jgi:acetyltransferase-like isoleucine patch superfamily enzyme
MAFKTKYEENLKSRSLSRFIIGLIPRLKNYTIHSRARYIARKRGATIGNNTVIPLSLAKKANKNLVVGNNTSIESDQIDMRIPIKIGNKVIIGGDVMILTVSHTIDSEEWEHKYYGIEIDDYAWLSSKVLVLPACRKIGRGAVAGGGSVVVKNIEPMSVVGGNPAKHIRYRQKVHSKLVVESLLAGDFITYIKTRKLVN